MGYPTRKRIRALRRAPDGSAFEKCEKCGELVAVAIADMHECRAEKRCKKEIIKRGVNNIDEKMLELKAQPRSAFRFFMECFVESSEASHQFDVDTKGFETWKNMSKQERLPYILQAEKVNSEYEKALLQEVEDIWVNEEADSAEVGRFDKKYDYSSSFNGSDGFESLFWGTSESFISYDWCLSFLFPCAFLFRFVGYTI